MMFRPSKAACKSLLTASEHKLTQTLAEEFILPEGLGPNPVLSLFELDSDGCCKEVGLAVVISLLKMADDVRDANTLVGTPLLLRLASVQQFMPFVVDEVRQEMQMPEATTDALTAICQEFALWCQECPEDAWEMGFDVDEDGSLYLDCQVHFDLALLGIYDPQNDTE